MTVKEDYEDVKLIGSARKLAKQLDLPYEVVKPITRSVNDIVRGFDLAYRTGTNGLNKIDIMRREEIISVGTKINNIKNEMLLHLKASNRDWAKKLFFDIENEILLQQEILDLTGWLSK